MITDLEKANNALLDSGVEIVLIGGAAMVAHGSAYVTRDADYCYWRSRENMRWRAGSLPSLTSRCAGGVAVRVE